MHWSALLLVSSLVTCGRAVVPSRAQPVVIGHRGYSGKRPEHTLASYQLAITSGADFVEPDLVATADGVLVCRHENEISGTTDVADHPEFASRRVTKELPLFDFDRLVPVNVTGWFTEDFTLAELRTLRARERLPELRPQNTGYDGLLLVPTFEEVLQLVGAADSRVGVYPEIKHPHYFRQIGLPLEDLLLAALKRYNFTDTPRIFVQSFEKSSLLELRTQLDAGGLSLPLVQLLDVSSGCDSLGCLQSVSEYADAVGPNKKQVIPTREDGTLATQTQFVALAHEAGLLVHPWTFRSEAYFLPNGTGPAAEYDAYLAAGIDGLFSDFPDQAVAAVRRTSYSTGVPAQYLHLGAAVGLALVAVVLWLAGRATVVVHNVHPSADEAV